MSRASHVPCLACTVLRMAPMPGHGYAPDDPALSGIINIFPDFAFDRQ